MTLLTAFDAKYLIPIGFAAAAIYSSIRAARSIKSGSTTGGKVKWFDTGGGWFSLIFIAAAVGSFIWMQSDK